MKFKSKCIILLSFVFLFCFGMACQNNNTDLNNGGNESEKNFIGIEFLNADYDYDGTEKSLVISGNLPEGAVVTYTNNSATEAGTYNASVRITKDGYSDLILNGTLKINPVDIKGIEFSSDTVEYDTLPHSINIVGNPPAGSNIVYTYNGKAVNSVTEAGDYNVKVVITCKNYNTFEKTATLKITSTEEQLFSVFFDNKVYFQNNLDDNKLYSYDGVNLAKVNNDIPEYMFVSGDNMYYYSSSLFNKTIKVFNGTATALYQTKGEYLTTDGNYIYFAINNLIDINDSNGIYKASINDTDNDPEKIFSGKAYYLVYDSGYLFFSNGEDDKKLYKLSVNGGTATKLFDEKAEYIIAEDGYLYFNSNSGLLSGSAIRKYNLSNNTSVKLTVDSGKYLTKIGNNIYYVRNDLLTSALFDDDICCVSALLSTDYNSTGDSVMKATDGDGNNLYYYRLNTKHFYSIDINTKEEIDLMSSFKPVEDTSLSGYAELAEYNGEIYYTNPLDNGCVYKYNPVTRARIKVLSDSVSGVWFNGGYMYYSTYILTQYALWRIDLSTYESVKINKSRCDNLIFDGNTIYYIKVGSVYNNYICKMNLDGTGATVLSEEKSLWVANMEKSGDYLYFTNNNGFMGREKKVGRFNLTTLTFEIFDDLDAKFVTVDGDKLYYYNHKTKTICSANFNGTETAVLISNVEVNDMIVKNGVLYYSSFASGKIGLYSYNISDGIEDKLSDKPADGMIIFGNDIYFLQIAVDYLNDYPDHKVDGVDGKLYKLSGSTVTKVA